MLNIITPEKSTLSCFVFIYIIHSWDYLFSLMAFKSMYIYMYFLYIFCITPFNKITYL